MKTNKKDRNGKDLYCGDIVMFDDEKFEVKYGNFTYLGTNRIGFYIEQVSTPFRQLPITNKVEKVK